MEIFFRLGETIDRRWRAANHDERAFVDIATEALSQLPPSREVDFDAVARWVMRSPTLAEQPDLGAAFGEPPLTVYRGDGFHIDVLVWTRGSTAIHQHGFSGAFHILAGTCAHLYYGFEPRDRISPAMEVGDIRTERVELLRTGDVRPIPVGKRLIHATYHLGRPSLSVVVRTRADALDSLQFTYRRPHLGIALLHQSHLGYPGFIRRLQFLGALQRCNDPRFEPWAKEELSKATLPETFWLLNQVLEIGGMGPHLAELVGEVRKRHGDRVEWLGPVLSEMARAAEPLKQAYQARQTEHHLFLSLLALAPGRAATEELLRQAYPDQRPWDLVARWVSEMAAVGAPPSPSLGLTIGPRWLEVLGHALQGMGEGEIVARFKERSADLETPDFVRKVGEFLTVVRTSPFFAPLFWP